jgi:voltage-gated sodium channel
MVSPKACKANLLIRYEVKSNGAIYFMANASSEQLIKWLEGTLATRFILGVIVFNAVILGLETSHTVMGTMGGLLKTLDTICLSIFVLEIILKLIAYRHRFFRNGWNLFDFVIVGIALLPSGGALSVLRALRILRVLRVISISPSLRTVVEGLVSALPGMGSVVVLMSIIFYVGAVIATKLFAGSHPEFFSSLGASAYSLFQIMTLESWSMGIVRPVMEIHPYAWAFFIPFILITTFSVVNLLVGLIVNSMQEASEREAVDETTLHREHLLARLSRIEAQLEKLGAKK